MLGLHGCTSVLQETSVELLQVGVMNWTETAVTVQIRVTQDDDVIEDVTHDLTGEGDGRVLDCSWPAEPGNFGVSARLGEDGSWETRDLTDPDSDCAAIWVMIERPEGPPSVLINRDCEFYADRC